jgi:hypothetical protein
MPFPLAAILIAAGTTGGQIGLQSLLGRRRPGQKVATTGKVNEIEPLLQENLARWRAGQATAEQAIQTFDGLWAEVVDMCTRQGTPGRACIEDRQPGGKFDWFAAYRDPLAVAMLAEASPSAAAGSFPWWTVPAALITAAAVLE